VLRQLVGSPSRNEAPTLDEHVTLRRSSSGTQIPDDRLACASNDEPYTSHLRMDRAVERVRPSASVTLTRVGRQAFDDYTATLRGILEGA
jgi:hypothetical protein